VQVDGVVGSGMASGAQRRGLGKDNVVAGSGMTSQAWGRCLRGQRCHRLRLGKVMECKGDRPWLGTMAWRLQGGLDDGTEAPERTRRWHGLRGG
jgi:hypothetical protein